MILFKRVLKNTFVHTFWLYFKKRRVENNKVIEQKKAIKDWVSRGKPSPPPPLVKRLLIKEYARRTNIKIFIETGTYLGETLEYCKSLFSSLISIELDEKLYADAKQKFSEEKHIQLYQGDSGKVLQHVLTNIKEPCLFWLDGHYSEGFTAKGELNTPIIEELTHIFRHSIDNHVILIDDAWCFTGENDYPTIEFLDNFIKQQNKQLKLTVKDDIIRIHK